VTLARKHGLNKTARALGLKYYSLKKHLEATAVDIVETQLVCGSLIHFGPGSRNILRGQGLFSPSCGKKAFFERNQVWTGNII